MVLPDVNVLVNAFRSDAADHELCRRWLERVVEGDARFGLSPQILASVLRVCTHRRVFAEPSSLEETLRFCEALLAQPHCKLVTPGPRHWEIFQGLARTASATGNLLSDAWLAALAVESGCEWITLDRDFGRFPGLRWRRPPARP